MSGESLLRDERLARVVEFTQELVAADSQNPPGLEAQCAAAVSSIATHHGLNVIVDDSNELLPSSRPNAIVSTGEMQNAKPTLLFLSHLDVVPAGEGWKTDPFECVSMQDQLYGRGVADTKGGLAAVIDAMARVKDSVSDVANIMLVAASDEEEGGRGTESYLRKNHELDLRGCVVVEPTSMQTVIACKGNAYFEISFHGKSAHASNPDNGTNAIYAASRAALEFRSWHCSLQQEEDALIGPPTWNVGMMSGGTGTAIVPAECVIEIDRRLRAGETAMEVQQEIVQRLQDLQLESDFGVTYTISAKMEMPGFKTLPDDSFVTMIHDKAASYGYDIPLGGWRASCDGGFVTQAYPGCPIVLCGPGDVANEAHRPNESVPIQELQAASEIFEAVMLAFAKEVRNEDR
ncbi:MAG: M20 family metallopeptidase [Bifidobacterium subtile]|jgi:acetylornithine deacetylase|nr:M20 family metallopeptidase [Bifidobacterium subtile]MCI1257807.1 M20 family metallopeptidase [Bifidobacterium subtile]